MMTWDLIITDIVDHLVEVTSFGDTSYAPLGRMTVTAADGVTQLMFDADTAAGFELGDTLHVVLERA